MNDLCRTLRNRRPPMVVRIQRKRHVTGPMVQPSGQRPAPPQDEDEA